jgi:hypothetical protein
MLIVGEMVDLSIIIGILRRGEGLLMMLLCRLSFCRCWLWARMSAGEVFVCLYVQFIITHTHTPRTLNFCQCWLWVRLNAGELLLFFMCLLCLGMCTYTTHVILLSVLAVSEAECCWVCFFWYVYCVLQCLLTHTHSHTPYMLNSCLFWLWARLVLVSLVLCVCVYCVLKCIRTPHTLRYCRCWLWVRLSADKFFFLCVCLLCLAMFTYTHTHTPYMLNSCLFWLWVRLSAGEIHTYTTHTHTWMHAHIHNEHTTQDGIS